MSGEELNAGGGIESKSVWKPKDMSDREKVRFAQEERKRKLGYVPDKDSHNRAIPKVPPGALQAVKEGDFVFPDFDAPPEGNRAVSHAVEKAKGNPIVPLGMLATVGALVYGLRASLRMDKKGSQMAMRYRVGFQGATVLAMVIGVALSAKS